MTITPWQLYWITTLDSITIASAIISGFSFILLVISFIEEAELLFKCFLAATALIFLCVAVFIPSTKQMAAILILPKIVNNGTVQNIPNRVLNLAEEWLDELRPKKGEGK